MSSTTDCEHKVNVNPLKRITLQQIIEEYGVSHRTIQRWVKKGEFPRPYKTGRQKNWIPEQVVEFMRRRGQEAQETQAARNMFNYEAPVRRQRRKRHDE